MVRAPPPLSVHSYPSVCFLPLRLLSLVTSPLIQHSKCHRLAPPSRHLCTCFSTIPPPPDSFPSLMFRHEETSDDGYLYVRVFVSTLSRPDQSMSQKLGFTTKTREMDHVVWSVPIYTGTKRATNEIRETKNDSMGRKRETQWISWTKSRNQRFVD